MDMKQLVATYCYVIVLIEDIERERGMLKPLTLTTRHVFALFDQSFLLKSNWTLGLFG